MLGWGFLRLLLRLQLRSLSRGVPGSHLEKDEGLILGHMCTYSWKCHALCLGNPACFVRDLQIYWFVTLRAIVYSVTTIPKLNCVSQLIFHSDQTFDSKSAWRPVSHSVRTLFSKEISTALCPGDSRVKSFTPFMISLKYITSLAFSQLCGTGQGCKKTPLYVSLQAIIIAEKTKQNEFCCAVWSMSVLIAVRACHCLRCYFPEWTYLHFC